MSKLNVDLTEFCALAIQQYGPAEVCDAVCTMMTALALQVESSDYYLAIDEAVAKRDASKSEALSQEIADFFDSIVHRYGEKPSSFELIASIAAIAARSHDNSHIRRLGEVYYEKASYCRRLLRRARH